MARYYAHIDKDEFLNKVQVIMEAEKDGENFPYLIPKVIEKDLSKVEFDYENYTHFNETSGFSNYPVGYKELPNGLRVFFVNAGGDWEYPICFIFYWSGSEIRAYIPNDGNVYHKKEKVAYGSHEDAGDDDLDWEALDKTMSIEKIYMDIINRITLKK